MFVSVSAADNFLSNPRRFGPGSPYRDILPLPLPGRINRFLIAVKVDLSQMLF